MNPISLDLRDPNLYVNQMAKDNFVCSICTRIVHNPVNLKCSHLFCKLCLEIWAEQKLTCPICRKRFSLPLTLNHTITELVRHLIIKCPNIGCNEEISVTDFFTHKTKSCAYTPPQFLCQYCHTYNTKEHIPTIECWKCQDLFPPCHIQQHTDKEHIVILAENKIFHNEVAASLNITPLVGEKIMVCDRKKNWVCATVDEIQATYFINVQNEWFNIDKTTRLKPYRHDDTITEYKHNLNGGIDIYDFISSDNSDNSDTGN